MDVTLIMKLFKPYDTLICDSFHIKHADSWLINDVLQILAEKSHDETTIIFSFVLYPCKAITIFQFAHDFTLLVDQCIWVLSGFRFLDDFDAWCLCIKDLVYFAKSSLADFIDHLVTLWQVLS